MQEVKSKAWRYLAKSGYCARGLVYFMIGSLALMVALGIGGKKTDTKGAISTLLEQPFGWFLLITLIMGLIGYVAWRFYQAIKDTDNHGTNFKGLFIRLGLIGSGLSYTFLSYWSIKVALGIVSSSEDQKPLGSWLSADYAQTALLAMTIVVVIVGIAHLIKAWKAKFDDYMDIPSQQRVWIMPLCRSGLIARGLAWLILALLLYQSAMVTKENDIKGMQDVLQSVSENYAGAWLLGGMALGLMAFGLYSLLEALYRRI
ncbi:DUF1206 domain-containing protein [Paraglaciecola sp.]|uniref:DUF1206 domain-containing protein n=1 Tax=Paraglaciecola sp. TaxID=1920173 RepID=UPI0027400196|nr:DUF1206 domain-containing protein [Paraglaciecola sp.]MDP5029463.1 DUF1206 domain-containing protein [Paraglaciecola sp.]